MKLHRGLLLLCILLVPVAALVFWQKLDRSTPRPVAGAWTRPLEERKHDPFPRTFVNASGESVEVAAPPQRVISGAVFSDAVLLEVCPPARVLALHSRSKDPRYSPVAEESARFPRHMTGGAEEILALEPDLVIVSSFSRKETLNLLSRQGSAVLRFLGFSSVADIQNNIRALGYVLDLDEATERLVQDMQASLDDVAKQREKRRVWRVLHYVGGYTSGTGTTFDSLLEYVGAHNVACDLGIRGAQPIQPEQILLMNPDVLIVNVEPGQEQPLVNRLHQIPGFETLTAVRRDRLLLVPSAWLSSTSHHAAKAAVRIAEVLDGWGRP